MTPWSSSSSSAISALPPLDSWSVLTSSSPPAVTSLRRTSFFTLLRRFWNQIFTYTLHMAHIHSSSLRTFSYTPSTTLSVSVVRYCENRIMLKCVRTTKHRDSLYLATAVTWRVRPHTRSRPPIKVYDIISGAVRRNYCAGEQLFGRDRN